MLEPRAVPVPQPQREQVFDRVFGFDELPAAKAPMESNAMVGKIVVKIV